VDAHLTFGFEHHYRAGYELWGSAGTITVERAFTPPPDLAPPVRLSVPAGTADVPVPAFDQFQAVARELAAVVRGQLDPAEAIAVSAQVIALLDAVRTAGGGVAADEPRSNSALAPL